MLIILFVKIGFGELVGRAKLAAKVEGQSC